MNQKHIGAIVLILGVILGIFVYSFKKQADYAATQFLEETGTCITEQGCLHEKNNNLFIFGIAMSIAVLVLGVYLLLFDKTQQVLVEHQVKVSKALQESKRKDEFTAFISGFSEDEQKILKAVKDQDGIKQSTLRYRTGMSKTSLSLILKSLEERDIVTKKPSGKTNEVYLRKRF